MSLMPTSKSLYN